MAGEGANRGVGAGILARDTSPALVPYLRASAAVQQRGVGTGAQIVSRIAPASLRFTRLSSPLILSPSC